MREHTSWWLSASDRDTQAADALLRDEVYEAVAFHCQQAAEKALKALVVEHRLHERSHACVVLCETLTGLGVTIPAEVAEASRRLDMHYIGARYPNGVGGPPKDFYDEALARECLQWAETVRQFVKSKLP